MSTFTDWNFPQASGVSAKDILDLIAEYKSVTAALANKQDAVSGKGLSTNDFTTALLTKLNSVKNFATQDTGAIASGVTSVVTGNTVYTALQNKVDKVSGKGLSTNDFTTAYKNTIDALGAAASKGVASAITDTNTANLVTLTLLKSALTSKVDTVSGKGLSTNDFTTAYKNLLDKVNTAIESYSIRFTFKSFNAAVGGSDDYGVYYILGMLDDRAGTAYIRFTDTSSFAAVVNFAVTTTLSADGKTVTDYKDGQLSVTTDVDSASLTNVHFKIVKGTAGGAKHVYLAVQATEWLSKYASTDGYGLFSSIPFEASGINFIPVGGTGYVAPTGTTAVLFDLNYYAVTDRLTVVEEKLGTITSLNTIGTIVAWPKYNTNGVATNVPSGFHACDGSAVSDATARAIIGSTYPNIDFHIIQIKNLVDFDSVSDVANTVEPTDVQVQISTASAYTSISSVPASAKVAIIKENAYTAYAIYKQYSNSTDWTVYKSDNSVVKAYVQAKAWPDKTLVTKDLNTVTYTAAASGTSPDHYGVIYNSTTGIHTLYKWSYTTSSWEVAK